jgi:hypothetical protein
VRAKVSRTTEPDLRGEIDYLLQNRAPDFERGEMVGTAWTAYAIAHELGVTEKEVRRELTLLHQEGRVTYRRDRSNKTFWKLTDDLHEKWQAFAGPGVRLPAY